MRLPLGIAAAVVALGTMTTGGDAADDAGLRYARATYEGRWVWSYGVFYDACEKYVPVILDHGPLRIGRIIRASDRDVPIYPAALGPAGALNPSNPRLAGAPLIVYFDPPSPKVERLLGRAPGNTYDPTQHCANQWTVADGWQLDVTYSLVPPQRAHPEWSARMRALVAAARVVPGMTHAMVAWALGFPSQPGTRTRLLRASKWYYAAPPLGDRTVYFRGDRVVRYVPPRPMP